MKLFIKASLSLLLLTATITILGYLFWYKSAFNHAIKHANTFKRSDLNNEVMIRLQQKASTVKSYDAQGRYDGNYCFLIDMRISSGKKRFFVYNLIKDSIETAGLVTHGSGSGKGNADLFFSNKPNSNCTSLGKYKIGYAYNGKFGLAFKLYGLEATNSKSFERFVVLHSHSCVPEAEVSPLPICESWGCPTVSPTFLKVLQKYILASDKPILLWIYY